MPSFVPKLVLIQKSALEYPLGRDLKKRFENRGIELLVYEKRVPPLPRASFGERFQLGKRTLAVSVRQAREFQSCRPSAHYQLPLVSGCPGYCEYCYLNTNLGQSPYVKVYVNVDEILHRAAAYTEQRRPDRTVFEGAATSDPVAVEGWTGALLRAVEFFALLPGAEFRFVTKYTDVESLLGARHSGKTTVRFSINCESIMNKFERGVPRLRSRLEAAKETAGAGYPLGFLIAPIFALDGWRREYEKLLLTVKRNIPEDTPLTFELITHRFTDRARKIIRQAYPGTNVPLDDKDRVFKFGQFGYGKYVYPQELMEELKEFFQTRINELFPLATILYFV
ncbi:MAG: spore photoproduct lyase [Bacillota bacterium]